MTLEAIDRAEVGAPNWSETIRSSVRSFARREIVFEKLTLVDEKIQNVRTTR
jgi:hypothetical protein